MTSFISRNLNYRILELESHIEDVDELRGKVASEESNANSLKRKLAKDSQAVRRQAEEIQQLKQCTTELEKNIQVSMLEDLFKKQPGAVFIIQQLI